MATTINTNRASLYLYRFALVPFVVFVLPLLALFVPKVRAGLALRRRRIDDPKFNSRPIWIHAASGEFEYAKSVIRELKAADASVPILVTYFSPTYAKNAQSFKGVDLALPLPLDLPGPCASFLKKYNPRALLLARTDFWPEMLSQTRRRGIPSAVFAYTQKETRGLSKWLARWRLRMVDQIFCVSPEDEAAVRALGLTQVETLGDTRYDQVRFRLDNPKDLPEGMRPVSPVLVAGSTWTQDEAALIRATAELVKNGRLRLVIVPHEPTRKHIDELCARLAPLKIGYSLWSSGAAGEPVTIVDEVGRLAELYRWANLAFVGGSFRGSVHSVMEAIGAGCATLVGPFFTNNREAIEFQSVKILGSPVVTATTEAADLAAQIEKLLTLDFAKFRPEVVRAFDARLGASRKLVQRLKTSLLTSGSVI